LGLGTSAGVALRLKVDSQKVEEDEPKIMVSIVWVSRVLA
jgi:hypothetical protein